MYIKDVLSKEVGRLSSTLDTIVVGVLLDFDASSETCTVNVIKNGVNKTYTGVPWFSLGKGIKLSSPRVNQWVVIGFIDNNNALPIVIGLLSNNGLHVESRQDVSGIFRPSRLRVKNK